MAPCGARGHALKTIVSSWSSPNWHCPCDQCRRTGGATTLLPPTLVLALPMLQCHANNQWMSVVQLLCRGNFLPSIFWLAPWGELCRMPRQRYQHNMLGQPGHVGGPSPWSNLSSARVRSGLFLFIFKPQFYCEVVFEGLFIYCLLWQWHFVILK